jgi:subtilisin family serine protease
VVFAAGNDSGPVIYPANLSLSKVVIAVSATNEWDQFKTETSFDREDWWGSCFGPEINVSAPGVHIYTTDISGSGGYSSGDYIENFNGTSSATPIVAGTAALVLSKNPGWTPTQVRNQIQSSADDLGSSGFDNKFGHGRINACNALGGTCEYTPPSCETVGVTNFSASNNIIQTLVNAALLFSTLLLFFLFLIIRKVKKRVI